MHDYSKKIAVILDCEGLGDCLFAMAVLRKIKSMLACGFDFTVFTNLPFNSDTSFVVFTHHPCLFAKCPYIERAYSINDAEELDHFEKRITLFDTSKLPHHLVDTFDFISIPLGIGELSLGEKQIKYFPVEEDNSAQFDVVINTSLTWPSRSWPINNWQEVADFIVSQGYSVAVVGKDVRSESDNLWKTCEGLKGCADLTNKLSLDQTYYVIKNCGLFLTCQNGLSVLSGATDTEIIVLGMSIEWSKRAIYRNEDPHYKVSYVKGDCDVYCCESFYCQRFYEFKCIPTVEQVLCVVRKKLDLLKKRSMPNENR